VAKGKRKYRCTFPYGKQYLGRREAARNAFFAVINIFWSVIRENAFRRRFVM
jgi:hypothetical protein